MLKSTSYDFDIIDVSKVWERNELHKFLSDCTDSFRYSRNGHVPDEVVDNIIQKKFISHEAIESFQDFGTRFGLREYWKLIGSVLISNNPDDLFIIDSNTMKVNLSDYPDYSPEWYHNVINYLVHPDARWKGVWRSLVKGLHKHRKQFKWKGISYRAEPPSFPAYLRMGWIHLAEYDKFSTHPESPIPPNFNSNKEFNDRYLPEATRNHPDHQDKINTLRYKYALIVNNSIFNEHE